jgi:hypothetical protein
VEFSLRDLALCGIVCALSRGVPSLNGEAARVKESPLTIVEDVQGVSADSARNGTASIKTRGSRRPNISPAEEREVARLYADTSTPTSVIRAQFGIGESSLYRVVQRQGVPLRGRSATSNASGPRPAETSKTGRQRTSVAGRKRAVTAQPAAATIDGIARRGAKAPSTRGRPIRRTRVTEPAASLDGPSASGIVGSGTQFRIQYYAERVFEAPTIQDALRQVESLGATDILGVERQAG